jgi:hypothetical protein
MSIPLTKNHEYAHDSFIAFKKQLYTDEKSIGALHPKHT